MLQVDLKASVSSACAGEEIVCESTLAVDVETPGYNNYSAVSPADFPPESYFLSKDDQLEWLSNNAFFDRTDSQRGNSANLNYNFNSNPSSQRYLLSYKASSVIGLPKPQETCFNEAKHRRNSGKIDKNSVFLKRVGSQMKTDLSLLKPSSPEVSCIGRVRSKRERNSRMHRQNSDRTEKVSRIKKHGCLASLRAIFRIRDGPEDASVHGTHPPPNRAHDM